MRITIMVERVPRRGIPAYRVFVNGRVLDARLHGQNVRLLQALAEEAEDVVPYSILGLTLGDHWRESDPPSLRSRISPLQRPLKPCGFKIEHCPTLEQPGYRLCALPGAL